MLFTYKVKLKNGEIFEGEMEAEDRYVLSRELRLRGDAPLSIIEKKENVLSVDSLFQHFFGKVKIQELIVFIKNLSEMLRAGLSISRALSVLEKQTKNPVFNKILFTISAEINSGGSLSGGFSKYPKVFSKLFVSMTRAGEESGNLAGSLSEVGLNLEKTHSLTKKVKGALIYPGVIVSVMIIIGILMFAFVVPALSKTFQDLNTTLPASTQFIILLGNFFSQNLILSFVLIIVFVLGLTAFFRADFMSKYFDYLVLKIPIVGNMIKELNTARTARTMSSLLLSGVSISRSIEITEDVVQNIYYKKVLREAKVAIEKGAQFSSVFEKNQNLYPVMMSEMVQVGEETGKLSEMLLNIAFFYEEEIENKTKNMSTIIEPVLMVIVGAAVGFFAVSMISPLYSVMENIK